MACQPKRYPITPELQHGTLELVFQKKALMIFWLLLMQFIRSFVITIFKGTNCIHFDIYFIIKTCRSLGIGKTVSTLLLNSKNVPLKLPILIVLLLRSMILMTIKTSIFCAPKELQIAVKTFFHKFR